jgi:hypothetical protein
MKSWFWKGMLAAAIALPALSGVAQADDFGCSNAMLNGEYAFGVTSYQSPSGRGMFGSGIFLVQV